MAATLTEYIQGIMLEGVTYWVRRLIHPMSVSGPAYGIRSRTASGQYGASAWPDVAFGARGEVQELADGGGS